MIMNLRRVDIRHEFLDIMGLWQQFGHIKDSHTEIKFRLVYSPFWCKSEITNKIAMFVLTIA